MNRYLVLLQVLDQLRREAPPERRSYHPDEGDIEKLTAARAKAFIHLLLKVYFGLLSFEEREEFLTDGTDDGGIDAYFIDRGKKTIYFVQSKFRQTEKNFEEKAIEPEELLHMDIDRVLKGETQSEPGRGYNEKILQMARSIAAIEGIGRYHYQVIILANARGITRQKLGLLTGGFQTELIDYHSCYQQLLFPLVSGTYFSADELNLAMTLSEKNAGSKISYSVQTQTARVHITVVFVPTLEIARTMLKYRNAILKYNPRSYLEHEGKSVNTEIRRSIEDRSTNEFALFNNGITIVSDETHINERIGQKDRAQLTLVNPQIINGGQTAYTLSQIYKENIEKDPECIFGEKEVLVKIITFDSCAKLDEAKKLELIDSISRATNSQTAVTIADRRSNENDLQIAQQRAFSELGILLERKRGEFTDGIREGYLDEGQVVDRAIFLRAALIAQGRLREAHGKKIAARANYKSIIDVDPQVFRKYRAAVAMLDTLHNSHSGVRTRLKFASAARVYIGLLLVAETGISLESPRPIFAELILRVNSNWTQFMHLCEKNMPANDVTLNKPKKRAFNVEQVFYSVGADDQLLAVYHEAEQLHIAESAV